MGNPPSKLSFGINQKENLVDKKRKRKSEEQWKKAEKNAAVTYYAASRYYNMVPLRHGQFNPKHSQQTPLAHLQGWNKGCRLFVILNIIQEK